MNPRVLFCKEIQLRASLVVSLSFPTFSMAYVKAHKRDHANRVMADKAHKLEWKGSWNEFMGKVHAIWGDIWDDDVKVVEGNFEQVIGHLEHKTGEAFEEIRRQLFEE